MVKKFRANKTKIRYMLQVRIDRAFESGCKVSRFWGIEERGPTTQHSLPKHWSLIGSVSDLFAEVWRLFPSSSCPLLLSFSPPSFLPSGPQP